jgi:hypothetical protein
MPGAKMVASLVSTPVMNMNIQMINCTGSGVPSWYGHWLRSRWCGEFGRYMSLTSEVKSTLSDSSLMMAKFPVISARFPWFCYVWQVKPASHYTQSHHEWTSVQLTVGSWAAVTVLYSSRPIPWPREATPIPGCPLDVSEVTRPLRIALCVTFSLLYVSLSPSCVFSAYNMVSVGGLIHSYHTMCTWLIMPLTTFRDHMLVHAQSVLSTQLPRKFLPWHVARHVRNPHSVADHPCSDQRWMLVLHHVCFVTGSNISD